MITNPTTSQIWKRKEKKRGKKKPCPEVRKNETKNCKLGFQCVAINIKGWLKICTSYPGFAAYLAKSSQAW
jgi:hypothetical protein